MSTYLRCSPPESELGLRSLNAIPPSNLRVTFFASALATILFASATGSFSGSFLLSTPTEGDGGIEAKCTYHSVRSSRTPDISMLLLGSNQLLEMAKKRPKPPDDVKQIRIDPLVAMSMKFVRIHHTGSFGPRYRSFVSTKRTSDR